MRKTHLVHNILRTSRLGLWLLAASAVPALADPAVEPATGEEFPLRISFTENKRVYDLKLTGLTARKKWFINVYAVAHYLESGHKPEALDVFKDGPAKQISIRYVRTIDGEKIRRVLEEDFRKNTPADKQNEVQEPIQKVLSFFDKPVHKNDLFVLRWLPGGTVDAALNGKRLGTIHNETFARILWSIWLGDHAVVNRHELMPRAP